MPSKTFYKSSSSYGIPHHTSTRGYSSSKGKTQSTMLVVLGIVLFVIIVGVIMYSSYNREGFFASPNKLVYLYMKNCSFCKEFDSTWDTIQTEVKSNSTKYNIMMEKLNLNEEGQQLSSQNGIDYAPAIVLITPVKNYVYDGGDRTKTEILKWVSSKI